MTTQVRRIIKINEDKCDGCGLCIPSCAEGALQIVDGKARLISDRFCDGLGNCLGECPQDAIEMIEREADQFDEAAVEEHLQVLQHEAKPVSPCACAGSMEQNLRETGARQGGQALPVHSEPDESLEPELSHWPIQLHLVSPQARFLQGQDLLITADCVPFAYADFHRKLLKGKSLLVGCPKLDDTAAYQAKLTEIFKHNQISSITLAYMEVPCCFGLNQLVRTALKEAGRDDIDIEEVVIGVDGSVKSRKQEIGYKRRKK
jgi:NAD-dependent dihydropyrimidine dehydrogenase PreA subunit